MTTEEDSGPSTQAQQDSTAKTENTGDSLSSQRVFKKSSPNNKLTLYLSSRDLVVSSGKIDRLQGVLLVDPEFVENKKVYGQVTLTFRYGREDEEVMGLKFCNEAIMCLAQLYPPHPIAQPPEGNTPLQEALLKRLGPNAYPFSMEITPLAPPSVQLVPAKEYSGAPIGTSYDVRAYVADKADEKLHRRTTVRMGIRVVQRAYAPPSPNLYNPGVGRRAHRERAKQHRKALFGCKSVPIDAHTLTATKENISRSEDSVRAEKRDVEENKNNLRKVDDNQEYVNGNQTETTNEKGNIMDEGKTHVSFKEHLTNGIENDTELKPDDNKPPDEKSNIPSTPSHSEESNLSGDDECEKNIGDQYRSLCGGKRPSLAAYLAGVPAPRAAVEKPFLLSDGRVYLAASLDKAIYSHGEDIHVTVHIRNGSNKTIRRIKVFVVQHVDVCMFSNGKFKNVVALINSKDDCPMTPGIILDKTFTLTPVKSSTKNWIALEDSYTKAGTSLASTVTCSSNNPDERNVFAIYVSYYVKVKLQVSVMGGDVSLKLPFTLMHTCSDLDHTETLTRIVRPTVENAPMEDVKPEKDGT